MKFFKHLNPGMAKEQLRVEYQRLSNILHPDKTKANTNLEMAELNSENEAIEKHLEYELGWDALYATRFEDALKQAQGESSGQMSGFAGMAEKAAQKLQPTLVEISKITGNIRDMFSMASKPKKRVTKKTRTQK